jgi:peptidoglycan/LPS O-acetylase OafA/YrhL
MNTRVKEMPSSPTTEFSTLQPMAGMPRFAALDGWRGVSILLVMAGHLLPLGPARLQLNGPVAALGMAIFFCLSGFLITTTLLYRPSVVEFLIRRLCRIVPLAWAFSLVALTVAHAAWPVYQAQLLFYSNLPPFWLTEYTGHLWSLGVEMQFYLLIAALCLVFGRRGVWSIPLLCVLVTAHRIEAHKYISIVTWERVDEILAGGTIALIAKEAWLGRARRLIAWINPWCLLPFAFAACCDWSGPLNYARPYLISGMVGTTVLRAELSGTMRFLRARWLVYVAAISYALYILHPTVNWGWLGAGPPLVKYAKRAPALLVVLGLAHLSTFYFEDYWIKLGKRLSKGWKQRGVATFAATHNDPKDN